MKVKHLDKFNHQKIAYLCAKSINAQLSKNHRVAWFLSGGSNIDLAVSIQNLLHGNAKHLLHVFLIDERYGPVGHKDSNWQQLLLAGFDNEKCIPHPLLTGMSIESETQRYSEEVMITLEQSKRSIGIFGIGSDGHTAGLLPNNPIMSSDSFYDHFNGFDFDRISATPHCIRKIDEVYVCAFGDAKRTAINNLLSTELHNDLPSRILKDIANCTLFTDIETKGST